jgi:GNAT superfamily N-acetyltransferase
MEEASRDVAQAWAETLFVSRREDDRPIGKLRYTLGRPRQGWLTFLSVEIEREHTRRGLGQEAVRLLEETAAERLGVHRFAAVCPRDRGLAFYFWLRLGYRPTYGKEAVWRGGGDEAKLTMVRDDLPR